MLLYEAFAVISRFFKNLFDCMTIKSFRLRILWVIWIAWWDVTLCQFDTKLESQICYWTHFKLRKRRVILNVTHQSNSNKLTLKSTNKYFSTDISKLCCIEVLLSTYWPKVLLSTAQKVLISCNCAIFFGSVYKAVPSVYYCIQIWLSGLCTCFEIRRSRKN